MWLKAVCEEIDDVCVLAHKRNRRGGGEGMGGLMQPRTKTTLHAASARVNQSPKEQVSSFDRLES